MRRARLHLLCCVKFVCVIILALLVCSNIHLLRGDKLGQEEKDPLVPERRKTASLRITDSFSARLQQSPGSRDDGEHIAPDPVLTGELLNQAAADNILAGDREHGLPNNTRADEQPVVNTQEILDHIQQENTNQVIHNGDLFGPVSNSTVIIAVQVHNRLTYLRQLIQSLSLSTGISSTLLVFSHDVWDEEINSLVRSIDFTQTIQIFYPFSLQTHPDTFPGESPQDCPRDLKPKKSPSINCTNYLWPDIYGHFREAKFTQTKHHWWWKANHIFHNLDVARHFIGTVVFLEEDHFVAEDFLHTLSMMQHEQENNYKEVDILCLGTYLRKFNYKSNAKQAEVGQWISSKHNMGMAFTRTVWDKIMSCSTQFCTYDDYNWDWSLQHVSLNCMKEKLQVMMMKGPRVFHIGECGVHHKKSDCDSNLVMDKVKNILKTANTFLFPAKLSVGRMGLKKKVKLKKGNGGWGDKRDHDMCRNITRRG